MFLSDGQQCTVCYVILPNPHSLLFIFSFSFFSTDIRRGASLASGGCTFSLPCHQSIHTHTEQRHQEGQDERERKMNERKGHVS